MTDAELAAIAARAAAATPGPWTELAGSIYGDVHLVASLGEEMYVVAQGPVTLWERVRNQAFVSSARTDVPALVAEVRRLRAEVEISSADTAHRIAEQATDQLGNILLLLQDAVSRGQTAAEFQATVDEFFAARRKS